jgi:hypothetical protein
MGLVSLFCVVIVWSVAFAFRMGFSFPPSAESRFVLYPPPFALSIGLSRYLAFLLRQ